MLVLSRKVGERISLFTADGEIELLVVTDGRSRGNVRLGIEAPQTVKVFRSEVLARSPLNVSKPDDTVPSG